MGVTNQRLAQEKKSGCACDTETILHGWVRGQAKEDSQSQLGYEVKYAQKTEQIIRKGLRKPKCGRKFHKLRL